MTIDPQYFSLKTALDILETQKHKVIQPDVDVIYSDEELSQFDDYYKIVSCSNSIWEFIKMFDKGFFDE